MKLYQVSFNINMFLILILFEITGSFKQFKCNFNYKIYEILRSVSISI